jgi:uncharacterized membrane protein YdbT with pleckstrin-like domain
MQFEQEPQENVHYEEETNEENAQYSETEQTNDVEEPQEQEQHAAPEETAEEEEEEQEEAKEKNVNFNNRGEDRNSFVHGLSVGLGIGCIATFVIMWITVFFTPQLPSAVTYENLLAIFIYPLIYLLTIGLIALTAGIVREYYSTRSRD